MGNCNEQQGQYYGDENTIDAYTPEQSNEKFNEIIIADKRLLLSAN